MLKKIICVFAVVLLSSAAFAADSDYKMINRLCYYKTMFDAQAPKDYLKIPFGTKSNEVAGANQDTSHVSSGVPNAFRADADGNVWLLDSVNKSLKQFSPEGKFLKEVKTDLLAKVIVDFDIAPNGSIAFLDAQNGYIYLTDPTGIMFTRIEGLHNAIAIEINDRNEILVNFSLMGANLRFDMSGKLLEQYVCDKSLSLFDSPDNYLYGVNVDKNGASLFLRTIASPTETVALAVLPYEAPCEEAYLGNARILGIDASKNIYVNLIACDAKGRIYLDRIYRCDTKGEILGKADVVSIPYMAPAIPRERVVAPSGKILTFRKDGSDYFITSYAVP